MYAKPFIYEIYKLHFKIGMPYFFTIHTNTLIVRSKKILGLSWYTKEHLHWIWLLFCESKGPILWGTNFSSFVIFDFEHNLLWRSHEISRLIIGLWCLGTNSAWHRRLQIYYCSFQAIIYKNCYKAHFHLAHVEIM